MAPNIDHVPLRRSVDIRVPPFDFTDPESLLHNFPELRQCRTSQRKQKAPGATSGRSAKRKNTHTADERLVSSDTGDIRDHSEALRKEICSPSLDRRDDAPMLSFERFNESESFLSADPNGSLEASLLSDSETADDLFDLDYVLPVNTQWWKLSDEDVPQSPCNNGSCSVVDVPQFEESHDESNLWSDVDSFVSVVDYYDDDVTSCPDPYEPVYRLDVRVTTIWGLDIIWEEKEDDDDDDDDQSRIMAYNS